MGETLFIDAGLAAGRDHFGPTIIVGNVLAGDPAVAVAAPFQYIGDPGDGTGIEAAFNVAAAAADGAWVHIRRGTYTLDPAICPLPTVAGFRVTGDGWATRLVQPTTVRDILVTDFDAGFSRIPELAHFTIVGSQAAVGATGAAIIDASANGNTNIDHVDIIQLVASIENVNESLTSLIDCGTSMKITGCRLTGDSNANAPLACIRIGNVLAIITNNRTASCDIGIQTTTVGTGGRRATIIGNQCGNHTLVGIRIDERESVVMGNRVGNSLDGIVVVSGSGTVVQGNSMRNAITTDEIRVEAAAVDTVVVGNSLGGGGAVVNDLGVGTEAAHNI